MSQIPTQMPPLSPLLSGISQNHLLAAIPKNAYLPMLANFEQIEVNYGEEIYVPKGQIRHVYFPLNCLISLLTVVDKNRSLEVGMVGNEGMAGMPLAMGINISAVSALVQGSGMAMRMTAVHFQADFKKNLPLQRAVFRYNHLLMAQISQTAACNRFHETVARLARWLLMTCDRLHIEEFLLKQEFLAHMLGVRRERVTAAAGTLQHQKLIEYSRGNLRILDRAGLEAAACTCYRIVKDMQDSAQPPA